MNDGRAYWRIVPKRRSVPDVYRRRFASRDEAVEVLLMLVERPNYEAVEYTPTGKRCVRTTADGTTIE